MTELNNSNNNSIIKKEDDFNQTNETHELNQTNDEFIQKIFELELVIKEKEEIINTLNSKIKEFTTNIELLKQENDKLKSQLEVDNKNNLVQNKNILQIQQTQRFFIYTNSTISLYENDYNNNDSLYDKCVNDNSNQIINDLNSDFNSFSLYNSIQNEFINENFKSKIIPFKMKPFQTFDHKKLNINYSTSKNNNNENKLFNNNEVINNINDKNAYIKKEINNNITYLEKDFKNDSKMENSVSKNEEGIKLHSSQFFQNCKKTMNKFDYKKLLSIVKLSNMKKISKEDTYERITTLLDENYPKLSNEFKLLFV